jgi:hypothetical protein
MLILCLSSPVLCGHTQTGFFCECGTPGCICDPGEVPPQGINADSSEVETDSQDTSSTDLGDELLLVFGAVLVMLLRYKA